MLLRTDLSHCILRPWNPGDKAALVRHANNRNVWRNLTDMFPHPYTDADAEAWFVRAGQVGPGVQLAIELAGEAIGGTGIIAGGDVYRLTGQFGYWLGEAHWGKGIATAAGRALVAHAFAHTDFVRLEAAVFAWNPASMRVLEKIGFQRECLRRRSVLKDGQLIDSVLYTAVRE
jgi:[ribosomal protein S5]-alanine N-acetyltransferase